MFGPYAIEAIETSLEMTHHRRLREKMMEQREFHPCFTHQVEALLHRRVEMMGRRDVNDVHIPGVSK